MNEIKQIVKCRMFESKKNKTPTLRKNLRRALLPVGGALFVLNSIFFASATGGKIISSGSPVAEQTFSESNYSPQDDGALDQSLIDIGANNNVESIVPLPNGQILIAGRFVTVNGATRNRIARLNSDGTTDAAFVGSVNNSIFSMVRLADGKILIAGEFTSVGATTRNRIARLNADGTLDAAFDPGAGADSNVTSVAVQTDGKILIGGLFGNVGGMPRPVLARLNTDGTLDAAFNVVVTTNAGSGDPTLDGITVQPDDKILIGGIFDNINGAARRGIARLNADGSLDASFDTPFGGVFGSVGTSIVQPDGRIFIAGQFNFVSGVRRFRFARLNADGTLDITFTPDPAGANSRINDAVRQADGKFIIVGDFNQVAGVFRNRVARINSDASLDASFNNGIGANAQLFAVALQTDGKPLIGGLLTAYDNISRNRFARLTNVSPTAASVAVSGRVLNFYNRPVGKAAVTLTDGGGESRTIQTNSFGCYRFADVPAGETYVLSVRHKRYIFGEPTRVLSVTSDLEDINFVAAP